jgi:molybdate transport system substrate-binding protein
LSPALADADVNDRTTLRVYAASSLKGFLNDAIGRYESEQSARITPVYASSGTLARQIANGAPADLFISAHPRWLDWLGDRGIALSPAATLATNRLALITSKPTDPQALNAGVTAQLARAASKGERVVIGDPSHVPAGIYARQALRSLGQWSALEARLIRAASARAAVAMVARSRHALGLVYRSDARLSERVGVLGVVPDTAHERIRYRLALTQPGSASSQALRRWLLTATPQRLLRHHGLEPPR